MRIGKRKKKVLREWNWRHDGRSPRPSATRIRKKVRGYDRIISSGGRSFIKKGAATSSKRKRESYGAATTHVDSFKIRCWWVEKVSSLCCRYHSWEERNVSSSWSWTSSASSIRLIFKLRFHSLRRRRLRRLAR